MIHNIKEELRAWLKPMSPITALAKSLRCEGPGSDDPNKASKAVNVDDPFAGFDFDEMPEDQRKRMLELKTKFETSFKDKTELEKKQLKTEEFARKQQSLAAKATAVLNAHNIPIEGVRAPGQQNSADTKIADLQKKFENDGLKPELAATYAKMFQSAGEVERAELMREMAPLLNTVGNLQATQHLLHAEGQFKQIFAIPEVAAQIRENVDILVKQGNAVDAKTIEHIVSMAWGSHTMRNPEVLKEKKDDTTVNGIPQFKGGLNQGSHKTNLNENRAGAPIATQSETVMIISELDKHLRQGLPSSKPAKK